MSVKTGHRWKWLLMALGLPFLATNEARADRRYYVWVYQYATQRPGQLAFEHFLTARVPAFAALGTSYGAEFELEYGLTRRWDAAVYQVFVQEPGGGFQLTAFKLETRFKLAERGALPVDPLLYLEYKQGSDLLHVGELEGKLVLARDFARFNTSLNLIGEAERETGADGARSWEVKPELAYGLSYELTPAFRLGVEAQGGFPEHGQSEWRIGPTISVATSRFFVNIGSALDVTSAKVGPEIRAIVGIDL